MIWLKSVKNSFTQLAGACAKRGHPASTYKSKSTILIGYSEGYIML